MVLPSFQGPVLPHASQAVLAVGTVVGQDSHNRQLHAPSLERIVRIICALARERETEREREREREREDPQNIHNICALMGADC